MAFCTGTATSTFGGGGGTKLFCSQALNATHANRTKKLREKAVAFRKCEGIIPVPLFGSENVWFARKFSPSMITNNPLAEEPETEMTLAKNWFATRLESFSSIAAAAQATTIRISSNDQHVKTWSAVGNRHIHGGDTGAFAGADISPACKDVLTRFAAR